MPFVAHQTIRRILTGSFLIATLAMPLIARSESTVSAATATVSDADMAATVSALSTTVAGLETRVAVLESTPRTTPTSTATSTPVPTATATVTATPTVVPPVAAGQDVPYGADWSVNVAGVTMMPTWNGHTAEGQFAQVFVKITNNTEKQTPFPFLDLRLRDSSGRVFVPPLPVETDNEAGLYYGYPPSLPTDGFVIFDVAADATGPFILESTTDPTFRVLVQVEVRG